MEADQSKVVDARVYDRRYNISKFDSSILAPDWCSCLSVLGHFHTRSTKYPSLLCH